MAEINYKLNIFLDVAKSVVPLVDTEVLAKYEASTTVIYQKTNQTVAILRADPGVNICDSIGMHILIKIIEKQDSLHNLYPKEL